VELELPKNYLFVLKGKVVSLMEEEATLARNCVPRLDVRDTDAPSPSMSRSKLTQLEPAATTEKLSREPSFVTPSQRKPSELNLLLINFVTYKPSELNL